MSGDLVGTLRYMSPEQALAKRVLVDQRTDVYSFGATVYELLALRPAFQAEVTRINEQDFRLLQACQTDRTLDSIIETDAALAKLVRTRLPQLIDRGWITGFTLANATGDG